MTDTSGPPLQRLLAIMARLRDPERGCPWDRAQTFESIAPYTIEEAYEVADAIHRQDWNNLCDELGDLLLQVVYHARMAEESGHFGFDDVAAAIADKMVRRHPHVFGGDNVAAADGHWERQKALERGDVGALEGVPLALPALSRAQTLQRRAAGVGFDWPDVSGVREKLDEEMHELGAAGSDPRAAAEEIGDVLFTVVNLARHLGVDAEAALRASNDKFTRRFAHMEDEAKTTDRLLKDRSLTELDDAWRRAKAAATAARPPRR